MSVHPNEEPACPEPADTSLVRARVTPRARELGGLTVGRVLPAAACRTVGPFLFFDHMGPTTFGPGEGLDVPPHPHIHLATVTYLFAGEIVHRDSLGIEQPIRPGELNLMFAGRGVTHSERTAASLRDRGAEVHGLQLWLGVPAAAEDGEPWFEHRGVDALPTVELGRGGRARVLLGAAWGQTSPARQLSGTLYVDVELRAGESLALPPAAELAAYVVEGAVSQGGCAFGERQLIAFGERRDVPLEATADTRLVLLGGDPLDGHRFMWWNFVSSRKEAIDQARLDYREGRFPKVVGDDAPFVPAPERS